MANVNAPFGFRPTMRTISGASGRMVSAHKIATYATALYLNDAVTHAASGTQNTPCIDSNITPGTTPVMGVNLIYGAASTATNHTIVLAGGGALFLTQGDGTGATFLIASQLSKNANMAILAGLPTLKVSKSSLSETSLANTNTLDLHVHKLFERCSSLSRIYVRL